jgi:dephospho-CoA kinase
VHLFGLTGGIASGKSAVAARLRSRGVPIIDADALSRDAVAVGSAGLAEVVTAFGPEVLTPDGALDRKKLAAIVFGDDAKRKLLNSIVHPRVTALTLEHAARLRDAGEPLGCYEAALIVENGVSDMFRPLVVVAAPEDVQVARACARDRATPDEARARIRAQMSLAEKTKVADYVIDNDGTLEDLQRKTDEVLAQVCAKLGVDAARYAPADARPDRADDRIGGG